MTLRARVFSVKRLVEDATSWNDCSQLVETFDTAQRKERDQDRFCLILIKSIISGTTPRVTRRQIMLYGEFSRCPESRAARVRKF